MNKNNKNVINSYELVWFGLVLWHINHCMLFKSQIFLYIYIKYIISKHILLITFLNESEFIFFVFTQLNGFHLFSI